MDVLNKTNTRALFTGLELEFMEDMQSIHDTISSARDMQVLFDEFAQTHGLTVPSEPATV